MYFNFSNCTVGAKDPLRAADDFIIGYERALPNSRPLKNPPAAPPEAQRNI